MREVFYELIKEASTGKVTFGEEEWPVGFNTKILEDGKEKECFCSDKNLSMLYIKEQEEFFQVLEEYINLVLKYPIHRDENEKIKWIMMYLFIYATTEDFLNPVEYIRKRIAFLEDHTFDELKEKIVIPLGEKVQNVDLEIKQEKAPITMETPNRLCFQLRNKEKEVGYQLPNIYYAIREEEGQKVCYIYSLLHSKKKKIPTPEEEQFQKKINRLLFKINDGVSNTEDYNIEGEENIKDVSMPFVFTLNIFISLLEQKGIEKIKAVTYLPVSYLARDLTADYSEIGEELRERNQRIQENQTNKFIRTFRRLSKQNEALQIVSYPYEQDEFLTMKLSPRKKEIDNMLLEEVNKKIMEEKSL